MSRQMLKTWIELVHTSREAGTSVRTKVAQLWNVGHGLPLDALKKGTIVEWSCSYRLADGEVAPLLDALIKNSSLVAWGGPASITSHVSSHILASSLRYLCHLASYIL